MDSGKALTISELVDLRKHLPAGSRERRLVEAALIAAEKGGPGSGWFAPPKGTHVGKGSPTVQLPLFDVSPGPRPKEPEVRPPGPVVIEKGTPPAEQWNATATYALNDRFDEEAGEYSGWAELGLWETDTEEIAERLAEGQEFSADAANEVLGFWQGSSNDESMDNLNNQVAASQEFGVPLSDFTEGKIERVEALRDRDIERMMKGKTHLVKEGQDPPKTVEEAKTMMFENAPYEANRFFGSMSVEEHRDILRRSYNLTQQELSWMGFSSGDTVRLFRGTRLPRDMQGKVEVGDVIPVAGNALESWSFAEHEATDFVDAAGEVMLVMDVPVDRIVGTGATGIGSLSEAEVVILGNVPGDRAWVQEVYPERYS